MATAYVFKGEGHQLPYDSPGMITLRRRLDIPDLIANGGLALAATPNTDVALPSTGFAAGDTLEIFRVPKGTLVQRIGFYVVTGEGATCTIDIGTNSATQTHSLAADDDGWGAAESIETAGVLFRTDDADAFGPDNIPGGQLYVTDGAVVVLFNSADTDTAVVDFWAEAFYVSDIS